jgi:DNA-binding LacI/PurR family transcriptional regulator
VRQRYTIRDVAAAAEVSQATVSRVLAGRGRYVRQHLRDRVERAARELGYRPSMQAAALRTNRTYLVGLILRSITNPVWPEVARGVQGAARRAGYSVVLANTEWEEGSEQEYLATARRAGFDGILISPGRVTNEELRELGIPAAILGSQAEFPDFDVVGIDTEQGSADAVGHLAGLGHRRIALIAPPLDSSSGQKRRRDYRRALAGRGLAERADYVVEAPRTREGGQMAAAALLGLAEPPTALLASNDQQAIGALATAQRRGLSVPEELSIVGFDDIDAASATTPPLTTLRRPQREYGQLAMQFLLERIEGRAPEQPRRRLFPCELVVRRTTGPAPA